MNKILVCVDGSVYADVVAQYGAWASVKSNLPLDVLHVLRRHSEYASKTDLTGTIGMESRSLLLEELTKVDEERGKLDQKKGKLILEHVSEVVREAGVEQIKSLHKRGPLVEVIKEIEDDYNLIIIGKRGEHAQTDSEFLGSNLEKVARAVSRPLFVTPQVYHPIKKFLIAYDGSEGAKKAVQYAANSKIFKELHCDLLSVENTSFSVNVSEPKTLLENVGIETTVTTAPSNLSSEEEIVNHVLENSIDLLLIGAYSHSRIRSFFLGSTTAELIKACKIPLILFR